MATYNIQITAQQMRIIHAALKLQLAVAPVEQLEQTEEMVGLSNLDNENSELRPTPNTHGKPMLNGWCL